MNKLWRTFAYIRNKDRIPKLPRGMLASKYESESLERQDLRVLARLGARDPRGIKVAMRRWGVTTLEALVARLEHYEAQRNIANRVKLAIGRLFGGYQSDPHRAEIIRDERRRKKSLMHIQVEERLKAARRAYHDIDCS